MGRGECRSRFTLEVPRGRDLAFVLPKRRYPTAPLRTSATALHTQKARTIGPHPRPPGDAVRNVLASQRRAGVKDVTNRIPWRSREWPNCSSLLRVECGGAC